jgi:hypothetical protein
MGGLLRLFTEAVRTGYFWCALGLALVIFLVMRSLEKKKP